MGEFIPSDEIFEPFKFEFLEEARKRALKDAVIQELSGFQPLDGKYRITGDLGEGKTAKVLRVTGLGPSDDTDYVLKYLIRDRNTVDFLQHIRAIQSLRGFERSPRYIESGYWTGRPAVVEQYLPGVVGVEFQKQLLNFSPAQRASFYRDLAQLLELFSTYEVIPVDLTAGNLGYSLRESDGSLWSRIIDFGGSYVASSPFNFITSEEDAARKALDNYLDFFDETEKMAINRGLIHVPGYHRMKKFVESSGDIARAPGVSLLTPFLKEVKRVIGVRVA